MSMIDLHFLIKENIKISIWKNLLLTIIYIFLIPVIRGTENLNEIYTAQCLEQSVSVIGIIMFVPLCAAEKSESVKDIMSLKMISYTYIKLIRLILSMLISILIICVFLFYMVENNCKFPYILYLFGTVSTMIFLGGIGFFAAELSRSLIIGYLTSVGFYFFNMLGVIDKKSLISLFAMEYSGYHQKIILLLLGMVLILGGINLQAITKKLVRRTRKMQ